MQKKFPHSAIKTAQINSSEQILLLLLDLSVAEKNNGFLVSPVFSHLMDWEINLKKNKQKKQNIGWTDTSSYLTVAHKCFAHYSLIKRVDFEWRAKGLTVLQRTLGTLTVVPPLTQLGRCVRNGNKTMTSQSVLVQNVLSFIQSC